MSTDYAPGFHVAAGRAVDPSAHDGWTGRWSRLFIPSLLAAAQVSPGSKVLDVSTGTGEAALMTLPIDPIPASIPQTYLALAMDRRSVRETVRAQLAQFEIDGKLSMSVEMLIGRGRAQWLYGASTQRPTSRLFPHSPVSHADRPL